MNEKLEKDYQTAMNIDQTVENIYADIFEKMFKSVGAFNTTALDKIPTMDDVPTL